MRALIADDSPFILSLLGEIVQSYGYEVVTAENGIAFFSMSSCPT